MKKILKKFLQNCQIFKGKVNAFTLVEVMLVIGIIGIVAVLTIPPLVQKYEEMSWQTSASVFHRRLAEAFKIMQIERTLTGHNSTAEFVNALGKKLKIFFKKIFLDKKIFCFRRWGNKKIKNFKKLFDKGE